MTDTAPMTDARFPYRIRVYGGRATHGAANAAGFAEPVTACGRLSGPGDEMQDDDAVINCRNCIREMNR